MIEYLNFAGNHPFVSVALMWLSLVGLSHVVGAFRAILDQPVKFYSRWKSSKDLAAVRELRYALSNELGYEQMSRLMDKIPSLRTETYHKGIVIGDEAAIAQRTSEAVREEFVRC